MNNVGVRMAVISGLMFLAACSTGSGSSSDLASASGASAEPVAVDAREAFGLQSWVLRDLPGHTGSIPTKTREPLTLQLVIGDAGPELRGQGGCNSFSMGVLINGATLKPSPIRSSKMACEHLAFESAYFGILGKVDAARRDGELLQLLSANVVVASYRR